MQYWCVHGVRCRDGPVTSLSTSWSLQASSVYIRAHAFPPKEKNSGRITTSPAIVLIRFRGAELLICVSDYCALEQDRGPVRIRATRFTTDADKYISWIVGSQKKRLRIKTAVSRPSPASIYFLSKLPSPMPPILPLQPPRAFFTITSARCQFQKRAYPPTNRNMKSRNKFRILINRLPHLWFSAITIPLLLLGRPRSINFHSSDRRISVVLLGTWSSSAAGPANLPFSYK